MSDIASLEADVRQYQEQVDVVNGGLRDDPGNEELLALKAELDEAINLLRETINEMRPAKPAPRAREPSPPPVKEKWSRENHPAFKKAAPPPPPEEKESAVDSAPVSYQVNDTVMAKWVSGDKAFYPARITSITGSSTDPIYIVKFKSYDESDQVRGKDIRPIATKRKADATPDNAASPFTAPTASSHTPVPAVSTSSGVASSSGNLGVISAAPSIDLDLAKKSREAADQNAADAKPKAKKIRATKELETGKKSWQEFNTKSKFAKATKNKKDSMFRTPEGAHGRVGFIGSGQTMRKDPTRSRHIYQNNDDMD
ncbi:uncharacterized protein B0I36DRAFT_353619 [Microdochium trichocladiopsis]|uniref:Tudor domain-containing protein n=1 Tax=Microdochium trichocladiopsis TaxID=1682393 RepID=A0A9P8XVF6_9PEZI|nr:uncharacterized protein B0I36DRAFT_353619 [Microdochium trichocladiopsis]KAH7020884.1 hypothetical protein B0I36DRAFT_353619 [Microdochium trichocladiopsis]